jgi:diacylglycerol kinase (ATP)
MTRKISRRWGRFAYLRAGARELITGTPSPVLLRIDGQRFAFDCLMLVVANGRLAGGAIPFAPEADPSDGRLDIVAITRMSKLSLLFTAVRVLRGRHDGTRGLIMRTGKSVEVDADSSFWFNLDGETWVAGAARFDAVPQALDIVIP